MYYFYIVANNAKHNLL